MSSGTSDTETQATRIDDEISSRELLYQAVGHRGGDDVAIAARDLTSGEIVRIRFLDESESREMQVSEDIPLGHKLALKSIPGGEKVTEYGRLIGRATSEIREGSHVHVHNLKSLRW